MGHILQCIWHWLSSMLKESIRNGTKSYPLCLCQWEILRAMSHLERRSRKRKEQVCDKNRISGCPKVHHDRCSSLYVVLTSTLLSTTSKRDRKVQFQDWLLLSRWEIEWIMKESVLMLIFLSCIVFHLSSPWAQIALDAVATATARCELYLSVKSIYPNAMMHPSDILDRVTNGHKDQQCDVAIVARTHTQTLTRKHRHTNTHTQISAMSTSSLNLFQQIM